MKRFLLAICVAVLSTGAYAQDYYSDVMDEPEAGDWGIGFGLDLGFGSEKVTNFGIQVPRLQYYFHPRVRIEGSFNYFFKSSVNDLYDATDWDVDFDVHPYVIPMKYGLHVYPIVGLGLWHRKYTSVIEGTADPDGAFRVGANVGVGFQYDITENIAANIQYKYFITNDYGHSIFGLGLIYRF